jgi:hypothetical protein
MRVAHTPQQKTAAAHVPSADEFGGEGQSLTESLEQRVYIFSRCYAAEKNHMRALGQCVVQGIYVAAQRSSIPLVGAIEIHARKGTQIVTRHVLVGSHEPSIRRNDERLWRIPRRGGERLRIR